MKLSYRKSNSIFFLFLLVVSFQSCESLDYEPEGQNYHDVKIPNNSISINLGNLKQGDTINAWGTIYLNFSSQIRNQNIVSSKLYLDSKLINSDLHYQSSPSLTSYEHSNGFHSLKLVILTKTNSNSLADKLGSEVFVSEFNWKIRIDNTPIPTPNVSYSISSNGKGRVTWSKYTGIGFQAYQFNIHGKQISITNQNVTEWIDDEFVGGYVGFWFYLKAKSSQTEKLYSSEFQVCDINSLDITDNSLIKIKFSPTPFLGNAKKYILQRALNDGFDESWYNYSNIDSTTTANGTELTDSNPVFGGNLHYRILVKSSSSEAFGKRKQTILGEQKYIPFSRFINVPLKSSVYLYGGRKVQRIDASTSEIVASNDDAYEFEISQNGEHAVALGNQNAPVINWQHPLYILDPITLSIERTIDLDNLLGKTRVNTNHAFPDNNGLILMSMIYYTWDSNPLGTVLADPVSKNIKLVDTSIKMVYEASPDAKIFRDFGRLTYKVSENSFQETNQIPPDIKWINAHDYILSEEAGTIDVINFETGVTVQTFKLLEDVILTNITYDNYTNRIGGQSNGYYWVFNAVDGSLIKKVMVSQNCYLLGSNIVSKNGYILGI